MEQQPGVARVSTQARMAAKVSAAYAAVHSTDDVRKPKEVVPLPEETSSTQIREAIDKIVVQKEEARDPATVGQHLKLLDAAPSKIKSMDESHAGITTRAVWLDWEGQKHKILPPPRAKDLPDFLLGKLYKKQQAGSDGYVLRDFRADMVPGTLSYGNKAETPVVLWIVPGCIIQRLQGEFFSRRGCVRIVWPSGYDLVLSGMEEEPTATTWYDFLSAMLMPTPAVAARRQQLTQGDRRLAALHGAAIRSQKWREAVPQGAGTTPLQLQKLALRVQQSCSDRFNRLRDELVFADIYSSSFASDTAAYRVWADGNPCSRYAELPECHYSALPSTTDNSAAWEALCAALPERHQEELRRFLIDSGGGLGASSSGGGGGASLGVSAAAAEAAVRRHVAWRLEMLPIRPHAIAALLESGQCYVRGIDHYGYPLVHFIGARHRPSASGDRAGLARAAEQDLKLLLYRLEQAIARLPSRDGRVSVLVRLDGAAADNRDALLLALVCKTAAEQYPERLHACYIYPATAKPSGVSGKLAARVVPVPDLDALLALLPPSSLPTELGGEDGYSFRDDVAMQGSGVLLPPLWVESRSSAEAADYYPPPAPADEWSPPAAAAQEEAVSFVCSYCAVRSAGHIGVALPAAQCAVCRFATRKDTYFAGWEPLDPAKYPEPSREAFLNLAL